MTGLFFQSLAEERCAAVVQLTSAILICIHAADCRPVCRFEDIQQVSRSFVHTRPCLAFVPVRLPVQVFFCSAQGCSSACCSRTLWRSCQWFNHHMAGPPALHCMGQCSACKRLKRLPNVLNTCVLFHTHTHTHHCTHARTHVTHVHVHVHRNPSGTVGAYDVKGCEKLDFVDQMIHDEGAAELSRTLRKPTHARPKLFTHAAHAAHARVTAPKRRDVAVDPPTHLRRHAMAPHVSCFRLTVLGVYVRHSGN